MKCGGPVHSLALSMAFRCVKRKPISSSTSFSYSTSTTTWRKTMKPLRSMWSGRSLPCPPRRRRRCPTGSIISSVFGLSIPCSPVKTVAMWGRRSSTPLQIHHLHVRQMRGHERAQPCELRIYRIKIYIFSVSVMFTSLRGHGFILRQSLEDVDPEIIMHI